MDIVVLGGGLVGGPMAVDLAREPGFSVTVADRDRPTLDRLSAAHPELRVAHADLSDPAAVARLAGDHRMAINALPGSLGFAALRAIIEAGRSVVDIAFFPEDPFDLDDLAREKGVVAVVDCGVAPGLSHLLAAHAADRLDEAESILILVGGLPVEREWPWEYKAVFSPRDVIEEYVRPARFVENGRLVVRPALSDPERIDFPGVGTLEAFNSDGLRTLVRTLDVPNMKEKTLRYPGHVEKMAMLRETGFFGDEPVDVDGTPVRPIDLTAKLLFPKWELRPGEADLTVMRVTVEGRRAGKRVRIELDLLDRYDEATGVHSMARTTGYTATAVARLLAAGLRREPGITPPEHLGRDPRGVEFVLGRLAARGVQVTEREETVA